MRLILDSPESYFLTEMTSKNNGFDSRGYFVCTEVVAARTGVQEYQGRELGITDSPEANETYYLIRYPDEVFSKETISSFNGAPFVDEHPGNTSVTIDNTKELMKGYCYNARKADFKDRDGNELLLVDVVVTDKEAIALIRNGKKEVSAGYSWKPEVIDEEKRQYKVKDIRANHLALVHRGRAGSAMILDEQIEVIKGGESMKDKEKVHKFSPEGSDKIYEVRGVDSKEEAKEYVIEFLKENKEEN